MRLSRKNPGSFGIQDWIESVIGGGMIDRSMYFPGTIEGATRALFWGN